MNYEELKVIWDSQNEEPVFAIDQGALLRSVQRKSDSIHRWVSSFELATIGVAVAAAIILPIDAWREGDGAHQYVVGAICLVVGVYAWLGRKRRRESERVDFDQSMLGMIERSLAQLDYHQRRLKAFLWGFHLPIALAAGIGLTIYRNTRITYIWAGVILLCALSYWGTQRDLRHKVLPEKRNLNALRDRLLEDEG